MSKEVNHLDLYRLPWNFADNGISWLEPTAHCNLACDGCYRDNRVEHKTFEETCHELDVFGRFRNSDALSIAGGNPLLYPDLLKTIAEASRRGYKPVINTNGAALTPELNRELKEAGLVGYTFHVDSKQGRPGRWKGKSEVELNALRDELADLAAETDISCAFNATIYPDTLSEVASLAKWAEDNMDKVQVMVFILYRDVVTNEFRFFNGEEGIPLVDPKAKSNGANGKNGANGNGRIPERKRSEREALVYNFDVEKGNSNYTTADDVIRELRKANPAFMPSAYLNGTEDPSTFKWLLAGRMGRRGETMGYVGPMFQELGQTSNHLLTGKYLAYAPRSTCRKAKPTLLLSPIDKGIRGIAKNFLKSAIRSPLKALTKPLHFQSVLIIQPIDMLPDGRMNMCDGCPDITVYEDKLVWSCRMDELEKHGRNLWAKPHGDAKKPAPRADPIDPPAPRVDP